MSDLTTYQASEGHSDEEMAAMLSEKLGRQISASGYKIVKGRKDAPPEWLSVLSLAPREPVSQSTGTVDGVRETEGPPETIRPTGVLPFNPQSAHMQITLAYTVAGKGAAMAMRSPEVAEVWNAHAPKIADAYIAWAREDANVARWINVLTLGGPKGDLVQLHASMIITTLIVGGKVNAQMLVPPSMRTPEETDLISDAEEPIDEFVNRIREEPNEPAATPPPRTRKPRANR
jgi:hypothetical protein